MRRTPRQAARIAIIAPDDAVFLLQHDDEEIGVHWATPGGGLNPGETPAESALRELREETGWTDLAPGPLLCTLERDYTRNGVPVRQFECIFLARGPRREPLGNLTAMHAEDGILTWHWWTPDELAATREYLLPPQLPALLEPLRRDVSLTPTPTHFGYVPNRR